MGIDRIDEHNIRNVCLKYRSPAGHGGIGKKKRLMFYEDTHFASFLDWFDTMIAMDTGYL